MKKKKILLYLSTILTTNLIFTNIVLATNTPISQKTQNAIKIDNKVMTLTGTIVSKATNDGVGYILNTADGSYSIIGPNAKSISTYANTDKKVVVTGNPAVGVKIIVMTSFANYVPPTPTNAIKIDNKVVTLTGTIVSKATNDGVGYILNTSDGSYSIIGPNAKSISAYANTDKKVVVTGNPAVGAKIIVMTSFANYVPPTPTNAIKIDNKVVTLTGTIVSKATKDGVGYILNTSDGSYSIIGPNAKSISAYANTDKKVVVTGNPAVGAKIIVMTSFANYISSVTINRK